MNAQFPVFEGKAIKHQPHPELQSVFTHYDIFEIDATALDQFVKSQSGTRQFSLQLGNEYAWDIELVPNPIIADHFVLRTLGAKGVRQETYEADIAFHGKLNADAEDRVSLSIAADGFLFGYIEQGKKTYYIEPLQYQVAGAPADQFLVYEEGDVVPLVNKTCAATETHTHTQQLKNSAQQQKLEQCYIVELALAADRLMFLKYGSTPAVANHLIGIINNVQTNYDFEFDDNLYFEIVEVYIVEAQAAEVWIPSTDAGALLASFIAWGPTGFVNNHDIGQLWTARDFDGDVIGIATLSSVCTPEGYSVCQDFIPSPGALRVLSAHEIGHNFSATHDPANSNTIMAPSVNEATMWSTQSITQISSFVAGLDCLMKCETVPTVPGFAANLTTVCSGSMVTFFNNTTYNTAIGDLNTYSWSFPGGSPSTSTEKSPTVTYANPGSYSVTLTVNSVFGPLVLTIPNYINVSPGGGSDFFYWANFEQGFSGWTVNNPDGGKTWINVQGQGTRQGNRVLCVDNPAYYTGVGQRDALISPKFNFIGRDMVTLELEYSYAQRSSSKRDSLIISISTDDGQTYPDVVFAAAESGFGNFATTQPNATPFSPLTEADWCYGGSFGASCLSINLDAFAQMTDIRIKIENVNRVGNPIYIDNFRLISDCYVPVPPIADFNAENTGGCAPFTVQFNDLSANIPTNWVWSFPGGIPSASTAQNPVVTYPAPGKFDVTLTVFNGAGSHTLTLEDYIEVATPPFPSFTYTLGNGQVNFVNNSSTNSESFLWDFGDGTTSTATNPSHSYSEDGFYQVSLTATNVCGSNTIYGGVIFLLPPEAAFSADPTDGCADLTVQFTNESTPSVTGWSWSFPGGIPSSSNDPNPVVTYSSAGTYNVSLTVINPVGTDMITLNDYITVEEGPTAGFTSVLTDNTVETTNTSTNADSYLWDFGDGETSTETSPVHTYATDGEYVLTLIATNPCGSDTLTQLIVVQTLPTADFLATPTIGCAILSVSFFDQSSDNTTGWQWIFTGGSPSTSTEANPVVEYDTPGVYSVSLIALNSAGADTLTLSDLIEVVGPPDAGFMSMVTNLTADFTNTTNGADSYLWDFGDGDTSTDTDPSHTYAVDGVYNVTLVATNPCGNDTLTLEVSVGEAPTALFSAKNSEGCAPLEVEFKDQSLGNIVSWQWTFPGGNPASSTDQNPNVVYDSPGVYNATLSVTNALGTSTLTLMDVVIVLDLPASGFTSAINGSTVDFTNTTSGGATYEWDFGDGDTSTDTDPSHTYAMDGDYTVQLIATNECGSDTITEMLTILTPPVAGFTWLNNEGCAPVVVEFTSQASENTTDWMWDFPGGNPSSSTDPNPTVTYDAAGVYDVTLTVSNAAGSSTQTEAGLVVVGDVPSAGFTSLVSGALVTFTNNTTDADSYLWDFGDGDTSTDANPSHTYGADGDYTVTLTATNACGSVTVTEMLTILTPPMAGFSVKNNEGCAPLDVEFTNESSENTTDWFWEFPGGTPATSTDPNPIITYNTAGVYDVTLTASNAAGSSSVTTPGIVVVDDVPMVDFTTTINLLDVDFANASSNADSYLWDFGDGETSTESDPSHSYATDGEYIVTLTATNSCGSVEFVDTLNLATPPLAGFLADQTEGCVPFTVMFMDQSSENVTGWEWSFPGGDPATSTDPNPIVTYNAAGVYDVTLVVSNAAGSNELTQMGFVVVGDVPAAGFTSMVTDLTVDLTNMSTDADSYLWDFGDGETSTESDPSHTYTEDGAYLVSLTATNECGSVTVNEEIMIVTPPVAGFTADQTDGCAPFTVMFTDQSSENVTNWEWSFPGGDPSSSTDPNPVVTYNTAGMYDVTLIVSNAAGMSESTQTSYIVVGDVPVAGFNSAVDGAGVDFTNTSTDADSYLWDFGDGETSTESDPSHTYVEDGPYTVSLTATNECGSVTVTDVVIIFADAPVAFFTANQTDGCVPFTVNFENLSSENSESFEWSFPGGDPSSSTDENPIVTYNSPGTYSVTLTAFNINGSDEVTFTDYITVGDVPTADFSPNLTGNIVDFTNLSTDADSYSWSFGDGGSSTEADPTHTYNQVGMYTVQLIATNECGSDTATVQIEVIVEIPTAGFGADSQEGCVPFTVQFFDDSEGEPTAWNWMFPGGTPSSSTEQDPVVTYNAAGVYSVSLTVTNLAGTNTLNQLEFIEVGDVPEAEFSFAIDMADVMFTNLSTGATTYTWDFGDGQMSAQASPTHTYQQSGIYTVMLTATNACGSTSFTQEVTVMLDAVDEITFLDRLLVFPNPNDGQFWIVLEGESLSGRQLEISLLTVLGQVVRQEELTFHANQFQKGYDYRYLAKGVYILQLRSGGQIGYHKLVID